MGHITDGLNHFFVSLAMDFIDQQRDENRNRECKHDLQYIDQERVAD